MTKITNRKETLMVARMTDETEIAIYLYFFLKKKFGRKTASKVVHIMGIIANLFIL